MMSSVTSCDVPCGAHHVRNPSRLSPPIFHTASDKYLGVGKAGYEATLHCVRLSIPSAIVRNEAALSHSYSGRYWEMVQRLGVNQFYTAPTALRLLLKAGDEYVKRYDRSSLRILACGKCQEGYTIVYYWKEYLHHDDTLQMW